MDDPVRSLNIPKRERSQQKPGQYYDNLNSDPLDQIMLNYLDMEEILENYKVEHRVFERQSSLNILSQRFDLPRVTTFKELLKFYDTKYATVRSYHYLGINPKIIMLDAAEQGNIQAFYNGLKMNPKHRNKKFYDQALRLATKGRHLEIVTLLKELGADDLQEELVGASEGGHIELVDEILSKIVNKTSTDYGHVLCGAVDGNHFELLKHICNIHTFDKEVLDDILHVAGIRGDQNIIDYLLSTGADDYTSLLSGAASKGRMNIVERHIDKPGIKMANIFSGAIDSNHLDIAKLVISKVKIDHKSINKSFRNSGIEGSIETTEYLISLGANDYQGLMNRAGRYGNLKIVKKYQNVPGLDFFKIALGAAEFSNLKILRYLIEKKLFKPTKQDLNEILGSTDLEDDQIISYLISLGADDYNSIVLTALNNDNLERLKKYFDKAFIDIDTAFRESGSKNPETYKFLISKGKVSQETLDNVFTRLAKRNRKGRYDKSIEFLESLGATKEESLSLSLSYSDDSD